MPTENDTQNTQTTDTTTTNTANTQTDTQQGQNADTGADVEKPIMNTAQLKERLDRDRKALLSKLGFDDETAMKTALDEAKKIRESQLSETEKKDKLLADAEKKAADAQAKIAELEHAAKVTTFRSAIHKLATDAKAKYADDVVRAAETDKDFAKWLEDETPDVKAIQKWLDAYKAARPDYFGNGNGNPGSPSNRNASGNPTNEQEQKLRQQLQQQTRRGF